MWKLVPSFTAKTHMNPTPYSLPIYSSILFKSLSSTLCLWFFYVAQNFRTESIFLMDELLSNLYGCWCFFVKANFVKSYTLCLLNVSFLYSLSFQLTLAIQLFNLFLSTNVLNIPFILYSDFITILSLCLNSFKCGVLS